ncbi:MAG: hypothetical protein FJ137_04025, partial [Deltaproteobacteria bacterium]|nr:hypothetical protein [Deltaproteobacteria bacterium]
MGRLGPGRPGPGQLRASATDVEGAVWRRSKEQEGAGRQLPVEPSDLPRPFGPYTLLRLIAQGGMGAVFLALRPVGADEARQRRVPTGHEEICVVKTVRADLRADREALARFLDEARVVQKLVHPRIASTLDAGVIDKTYYLCLEFISGRNLRDLTVRAQKLGEVLPEPLIFHVVADMLDALDHAHRARDPDTGRALNVVHRDVSPHNVMLGFDGNTKLIDFGLAAHELKRELTRPGVMVGKLRYNAPEQVRDRALDGRSDVYSAGVVLYEFVANERFYEGLTEEMVWKVAMKGDHRPRSWRDIDDDLRRLIDVALQNDPTRRYRSASEFRAALIDVAEARGVSLKNTRREASRFLQKLFASEQAEEREMILQATGIAEARTRLFRSPSDLQSAIGNLGAAGRMSAVDMKTEILGHNPEQLRELHDMMSRLAAPDAITHPPTDAAADDDDVGDDSAFARDARNHDSQLEAVSAHSLVTAASRAGDNRLRGGDDRRSREDLDDHDLPSESSFGDRDDEVPRTAVARRGRRSRDGAADASVPGPRGRALAGHDDDDDDDDPGLPTRDDRGGRRAGPPPPPRPPGPPPRPRPPAPPPPPLPPATTAAAAARAPPPLPRRQRPRSGRRRAPLQPPTPPSAPSAPSAPWRLSSSGSSASPPSGSAPCSPCPACSATATTATSPPAPPSSTPVPLPSPTPVPLPSSTPVPLPSSTPVPLPSSTPVPLPSSTPARPPARRGRMPTRRPLAPRVPSTRVRWSQPQTRSRCRGR